MVKVSPLFKTIFRDKPALLLAELYKNSEEKPMYWSTIAKQIDCTYSHVVKILQILEKHKLVIFKKQGRLKMVTLTDKGYEVSKRIDEIKHLID